MKLCKFCIGEVPDAAKTCMHCGRTLEKPFWSFWGVVMLVGFIGLIVASANQRGQSSSGIEDFEAKDKAAISAEVWVKDQMPLSDRDWEWPQPSSMVFIKQPDGGYEVKSAFEFHPEDGGVERHSCDVYVGPPTADDSYGEVKSGNIF